MVDAKACLFCRIMRGEIPAKKVYEDAQTVAFLDINPRNPGHTLVVPKAHVETLLDLPDAQDEAYFRAVKKVAALVQSGVRAQGISIAQNNGQAAGQVVGHLHFHVIPRFANEGPVALEGILPVRKMDDKSMDQIAQAIAKAGPGRAAAAPERPKPAPASPPAPARAAQREERKEPAKKKEEDEEFEEIGLSDFDDEL